MKNQTTITIRNDLEGVAVEFGDEFKELNQQLACIIVGLTKTLTANPYVFAQIGHEALLQAANILDEANKPQSIDATTETQGNA